MQARLKLSRNSFFFRALNQRWSRMLVVAAMLVCVTGLSVFAFYYNKYARLIDATLKSGSFTHTSMLYASPRPVIVGDETRVEEIASYLRKCGYSESNSSRAGWYRTRPDAIEVNPGPDAYDSEGAVIKIAGGRVTQIISQTDHTERTRYSLEPEPITNLFDKTRVKRRIVHYDDIPKVMVDAALAAEDKHFFQHSGFDEVGMVRALWKNIWSKRLEGASTITQQLARLPLGQERGFWVRKVPEAFITVHLESTLTKKQIFEDYANSIYLGNQGSFSINGYAQGAQAFLGKDLSRVTIADAALLAGLPQGTNLYNPFRHKDKALARRNIVLKAMLDDEKISEKQYTDAVASPLGVTREEADSNDASYFVDLVNEQLLERFKDRDFQTNSYSVYTSLNMELQHDLVAAVKSGILETDQLWHRRSKKYGTPDFPAAQVAAVALDAETGAVLALVGGRRYGDSQLDHALAERQPGSSFKPIVYATALATALDSSSGNVLTPASIIVDEPTTFYFEQQPPYVPKDFEHEPPQGPVTLRFALAHSLNIPAVKLAEMVGYDRVVNTARSLGLNNEKPTPSIALGSYEATPIEMADAYTAFVNGGDILKTTYIKTIRDQTNQSIFESKLERHRALDPRVAYVVENMMEEVLQTGTAAGARSRGFYLPAAGKTGTSEKDGWFVGFTSKIICAVWVGFDDNHDFKFQGAQTALPIWTDFMKRAHQHREYRNVHEFEPPDGIVTAEIDADTGELASPACPHVRSEVFIAGSQPVTICHLHGNGKTVISGWEPVQTPPVSADGNAPPVVAAIQPVKPGVRSIPITPAKAPEEPAQQPKSFWNRVKDLLR